MDFVKYQHLERFGTTEVENINFGECYIFPKIDGTNASVWLGSNGVVQAGSRNRHLSLESDNAGFYAWVLQQKNIEQFLKDFPNLRLFGEWLVPHSLKTYREEAWRKFYVFDVAEEKELNHEGDHSLRYLPYEEYRHLIKQYDIDYVPAMTIIKNAGYEKLVQELAKNVFLIEDGKGAGEGIVIKNYDFKNKYGRNTFAKIVTSEFKEKHSKVMGATLKNDKDLVEEKIADKFVTVALIEKTKAKIETEAQQWSSKFIPRLLNTVYYDVVREDIWEILKEFKEPTINFRTLKHFVTTQVKTVKPELF
jgi:ATP-dependent DNA ligase, homolog of eukaryotic ligase III